MSDQTPKRYDLITNYRAGSSIEEMEPADDGDWVRWEAIKAERATLTARCEALQATVSDRDAENASLRDAVDIACSGAVGAHARCEALGAEAETERMRLAACTTAALGNTPERVAERLAPGHPYWSASYGDVCGAVDREIALRERCEALTAERDREIERVNAAADITDARLRTILDLRAELSTYRSRCQHLEQAMREMFVAGIRVAKDYGDNAVHLEGDQLERQFQRALASLLPTPEETPGTDENRVSFAAGYTAALDDALKGKL